MPACHFKFCPASTLPVTLPFGLTLTQHLYCYWIFCLKIFSSEVVFTFSQYLQMPSKGDFLQVTSWPTFLFGIKSGTTTAEDSDNNLN